MNLKVPPYGGKLYHLLQSGQLPLRDIYIFMGKRCWESTHAFNVTKFAMCYPNKTNPFQYYWPVNQCDIIIFDRDKSSQEFIDFFASCLFYYGANIIRYVSHENKVTVFKKEF